jgi:hypothetical protein
MRYPAIVPKVSNSFGHTLGLVVDSNSRRYRTRKYILRRLAGAVVYIYIGLYMSLMQVCGNGGKAVATLCFSGGLVCAKPRHKPAAPGYIHI